MPLSKSLSMYQASIPLLLRHGADPNLRNKDGKTALEATEKNQPKHEALLTAIRVRASSQ